MAREFQIGEWLVEPDLNCINKGKNKISVEPKVIEVLVCLADCPGEVLSKKQIIKTVWPDTFVSEEVLRYSISELRKAFKDDAKNPRVIQTIARRGYRLIAPVTKKDSDSRAKTSIAVLAFSDMSALKGRALSGSRTRTDQRHPCPKEWEQVFRVLQGLSILNGLYPEGPLC